MKRFLILLFLLALGVSFTYSASVKGIVKDSDTDDPLIGANIVLKGTGMGATTDEDGFFLVLNVPEGEYVLQVSYVGYNDLSENITVGTADVELQFSLKPMVYSGSGVTVLADRAKLRETPVAFSDVAKKQIEVQLGSRDIPMVLNVTPSVYATQQGGGAGDARINIRGFDQRNVAVMINGVPVNDMENGWVYWSNWDGVGDAAASIQVQRGLSAVNLAVASIGGTMNIITDPSAQSAGARYKQEFGNDGFLKSTFIANSGLINGKYAFNGTIVRKIGDGLIDKTWTDAWAYYFGASWIANKDNRLEFYAVGAPQRHGQNLYKQNIATYNKKFAEDLGDYDPAAFADYNDDYAETDPNFTDARKYNENWGPVSSSYTGKQYFNGKEHDRYDKNFINERENYYHKPQVNLNWYSHLAEKLDLYSTVYYSGGKGGGTGTFGSLVWDYSKPSRTIDFDGTIARNSTNIDSAYSLTENASRGILRNSVNTQWTIGAISKANYKFSNTFKGMVGVDWRTAEIEHFREVRDLLGGDYYVSTSSDFWTHSQQMRRLGDKIDYHFTNTVDWFAFFGQGEYKAGRVTGYGTAGYSMVKYTYTNHFRDDGTGNETKAETDQITGGQVKGGASYRVSQDVDVFGNVGYISKVPIFDDLINDRTGTKAKDPKNERYTSFEGGVNYRAMGGRAVVKTNFYYTIWKDKSNTVGVVNADGSEGIIFLQGTDLIHTGVELEGSYQPNRYLRIDGAASVANWKYTDDVSGVYKDYSGGGANDIPFDFYVKDIKDGDAPQTQFSVAGSVFPIRGLMTQVSFRYYTNHYAQWDPFSRTDPNDRTQSWKAPSYSVIDLHAAYDVPLNFRGVNLQFFLHVFNLLDQEYIQDAVDNSRYNGFDGDHDADDAEVFFGLPRSFNLGLVVGL